MRLQQQRALKTVLALRFGFVLIGMRQLAYSFVSLLSQRYNSKAAWHRGSSRSRAEREAVGMDLSVHVIREGTHRS